MKTISDWYDEVKSAEEVPDLKPCQIREAGRILAGWADLFNGQSEEPPPIKEYLEERTDDPVIRQAVMYGLKCFLWLKMLADL